MKPLWLRNTWDYFSARFPRLACDLEFLRRNRRFEPDLWLIPQYCRRDVGAVDIGANMGIFSRWMARHAGKVDSFECNPHLFEHLERFLPRNVSLHRCALSSAPGRASLRFDPGNTGIGTIESANRLDKNPGIRLVESIEVEVSRLDDFQLGPCSFVKIDVEGHELEVLKGARQFLERNRPTLLIEIEERHCPGNLKAVPEWLAALNYDSWVLGDQEKLAPALELEIYSARCNNFWFLPRSATSDC